MQSDFDLDDVDFGFIQSINDKEIFQAPRQDMDTTDDPSEKPDVDNGIALGVEAYRKSSLVDWKPGREEHGYDDQPNLSVPKSIDSPGSPVFSDQKILSEPLSQSSRDLVFGMILKTCRRANRTRIMSSFPSTEMFDSLLQQFFKTHAAQVDAWIHVPSFKPNGQCPELLAALAAAGAVNSPIPPIRKLGYALLEIVRIQLPVKVSLLHVMVTLLFTKHITSLRMITQELETYDYFKHLFSSSISDYGVGIRERQRSLKLSESQ